MLELLEQLITDLLANASLIAIVPTTNIFTGPVDETIEANAPTYYPSIVISVIAESFRSVPLNTRDTQIQLDIRSINSQLEIENIYEAIITTQNYVIENRGTAHIFWEKISGAVDYFDTDRRVWHRACTLTCWSMKPR